MDEPVFIAGKNPYADHTTVHPVGLLAIVVLGICVLLLPRRWSTLPFMVMACFVPSAQRIVIIGMDFDFLRIMVLFGVFRLFIKNEYAGFTWKSIDKIFILWVLSSMLFYVVQMGTSAAFINRLGFAFDAFGMYFLFRCLIRDWLDVDSLVMGCIWISIPIAMFFLIEYSTGRNLFSMFGGVSQFTEIREEHLRCQGAFSHPILAGCFWAALLPLFASRWWKSARDRIWVIISLAASLIIVFCCASSTPVMAVAFVVIGAMTFYFRNYLRLIRWGILFMLISLHMVMKAPVWHLISRVDAVGGSTGWHRYNLINQAIKHFDEWWFCGCSGYRIEEWGVFGGDVTNQYVLEGVTGGFLTMCLFIAVVVLAFREVGYLWHTQTQNHYRLALSWAMGVCLFVHCMNFIGVSYFGQINVIWYMLLAMISSISCYFTPTRIRIKNDGKDRLKRIIRYDKKTLLIH
jgi:hypothetical protein